LNTVAISQGSGAITFSGDVFANNLATINSGAAVVISGAVALNFNNSTLKQDNCN